METTPTLQRPWFPRTVGSAGYLLGSFPLHLAAFIVTVVGLSFGLGTLIIWLGVPALAATLYAIRGFATLERHAAARMTGRPVPRLPYTPAPEGASTLRAFLQPLRDPQAWLDALWGFVSFIVSTLTFCLGLLWVLAPLATIASPVAFWIQVHGFHVHYSGLGDLLDVPFPELLSLGINMLLGLILTATAPLMLPVLARAQLAVGEGLLSMRARDRAAVAHLTGSRDAIRQAETHALRRLERDIHDGPQQRLVRLNMDLARAQRQFETDPEMARTILADAQAQAQETLAELRQLSRGIAPPILVDRGLEAAISEAAARSSVPVTIYASLPDLPDHVATAAYFVTAESLVNVNKHSQAASAEVFAAVQDEALYLTISDDGIGGADAAKGHGLAGLAERLRGVDGTLKVSSPVGGPTQIEAVIPCGS